MDKASGRSITGTSKFIAKRAKWLFAASSAALSLVMALSMTTPAFAASFVDMTTDGPGRVEEATINGAVWKTLPITDATGSGVFNAFFRVQASPTERGYNTDGRPLQFNELTSTTFTHSALLADVPVVEYPAGSGNWYYEFQLDINESKNTPYVSLDEFQVWTSNDPNLLGYNEGSANGSGDGTFPSGAELVYNLDGAGDTWIGMDYRWNTGSGKRDYKVLVPASDFVDKDLTYAVIFTRFGLQGGTWESDDGFEEWGVAVYPKVPDTAVTILSSKGMLYAGQSVDLTVTEANTGNAALSNPYVEVSPGAYTLDKASPYYVSGDANSNGVLDVAEVWLWKVTGVVINSDTTFTALGHGIDSLGNDISFANGYTGEKASVAIDVISPNTLVGISTSAATVYADDAITLTVTEKNTGDVNLTGANVVVDHGVGTLSAPPTSGDDGDGILEPDETWSWTVTGVVINSDTTFTALGHGIDPLGNDVTYPAYTGEQASVAIDVISPDTLVGISTSAATVYAGNAITLTVTEKNTGDVNLTAPYVTLDPGAYTLNKASPYYDSGDADSDDVLDVGETWKWIVTGVAVDSDTTFTATGHGADPLGNDVTYPAYTGEQASVAIDVISPDTLVGISTSAATVYAGNAITLTVTEKNTGDVNLTAPYVTLDPGAYTLNKVSPYYDSGDANSDGVLDVGETWKWIVTGVVINSDTTFTALGHGADPLGTDISFASGYKGEKASVDVDVIHPDTLVGITPSVWETLPGGNVILTITEKNTGDCALAGPYVEVVPLVLTLTKSSPNFVGGDTGDDGVLGVGETWEWSVSTTVSATTTFTVTGHGIDPLGNDVTYPAYTGEQASATVKVGGATRTLGFWKTHLTFTEYVFSTYAGGSIDLGWKQVTSMEEMMGIFWANTAKNCDGTKRDALCQARVQASWQALAAILNSSMPGGAPLPGDLTEAKIASIIGGTNKAAINALAAQLDAYNNSGDAVALDPSLSPTGRANPQGARDIAILGFADCH